MAEDFVFLVDRVGRNAVRIPPTSLVELGLMERQDFQAWILGTPEILGEPLLVVSDEYDRFDRSDRRLDVLCMDKQGQITIVELKREADGTLADLQALRYAAFCSTMTEGQLIELYAEHHEVTSAEATQALRDFVEPDVGGLPSGRPRIIIAAGSLDDVELTSTVLWLRQFGVDITCVEVGTYELTNRSEILVVPRVLIPLKEAREFMVGVEQQAAAAAHTRQARHEYAGFFDALADEFDPPGTRFKVAPGRHHKYLQIRIGKSRVHYEWNTHVRESALDVCLHFEHDDVQENLRLLSLISPHVAKGSEVLGAEVSAHPWGKKWAEVRVRIPCNAFPPPVEIVEPAARLMERFIEWSFPFIESEVTR